MQPEKSSKFLAFLSYLLFFFGIVPLIIWVFKKRDSFVKFHVKQSVFLFYFWASINLAIVPLMMFFEKGLLGFFFQIISIVISLFFFRRWVRGMILSAKGLDKSILGEWTTKRYALWILLGLIIVGTIEIILLFK